MKKLGKRFVAPIPASSLPDGPGAKLARAGDPVPVLGEKTFPDGLVVMTEGGDSSPLSANSFLGAIAGGLSSVVTEQITITEKMLEQGRLRLSRLADPDLAAYIRISGPFGEAIPLEDYAPVPGDGDTGDWLHRVPCTPTRKVGDVLFKKSYYSEAISWYEDRFDKGTPDNPYYGEKPSGDVWITKEGWDALFGRRCAICGKNPVLEAIDPRAYMRCPWHAPSSAMWGFPRYHRENMTWGYIPLAPDGVSDDMFAAIITNPTGGENPVKPVDALDLIANDTVIFHEREAEVEADSEVSRRDIYDVYMGSKYDPTMYLCRSAYVKKHETCVVCPHHGPEEFLSRPIYGIGTISWMGLGLEKGLRVGDVIFVRYHEVYTKTYSIFRKELSPVEEMDRVGPASEDWQTLCGGW